MSSTSMSSPQTLLNSEFPAPVAARRPTPANGQSTWCSGALSQALPDRVIAAANGANTTAVFSGVDPRTGNPYLYLETLGGGMGRTCLQGRQGWRSGRHHQHLEPAGGIHRAAISPARRGIQPCRGLRWRRKISRRHGIAANRDAGRSHLCLQRRRRTVSATDPWGLFGGEEGGSGQFLLRNGDGEHRLDDKPGEVSVSTDARVVIETPGAGGYGHPAERSEAARRKPTSAAANTRPHSSSGTTPVPASERQADACLFHGTVQAAGGFSRCHSPG